MENQNNTNQLDFKRILLDLWKYRIWFLITLSISVVVAGLYVKYSSETYTVGSSILIKIRRNYTTGSADEYLNINQMMGMEINLSNEINVLQSTPIIKEVVEDLGLSISYSIQEDKLPRQLSFSLNDIYGESPFIVVMDQDHSQPLYSLFYVNILNDLEFSISYDEEEVWLYNFNNEEFKKASNITLNGIFKFGESISSDFFSFKILLNSNFNPTKYLKKDLFFQFNNLNDLAFQYQKVLGINATMYPGSIANITFTGDNIQKSLDFINGLTNKYIEKNLEEKTYLATTTIQYIDRQLENISDTLSKTERELQNFRRTYNIVDPSESYNRLYAQLDELETEKNIANRRLNHLQQSKAYFDGRNVDASNIMIPSSIAIEDPILDILIQELITLNSEKEQLIQNNQLRSPRLPIVNASIENLVNSITENLDFNIKATTSDLQNINNRIADVNEEYSRLPQTQRRLLGIERQFNLTQDVYNSLMQQRIQAQIARSSTLSDCEIIEPAYFIAVASPNPVKSLAIAFIIGFIFPVSYFLGRILLSDKIEDKKELKKLCKLTQIGELPEYKKITGNIMIDEPTEILAESFRSLRSNIDFFLMGEKHKIILITSSIPKEGKSMSSLNLATAFALTNSKTLLLKLDLRKTSDNNGNFRDHELVGISDYLIRQANLEDIITKTEVPELDIITSGTAPPNPVELLTSERTKDVLLQAKQQYDYVIIDTPPFGLVTDAFILMKYTDLNIYLTRLDMITRKTLIPNLEEITSKKLSNIYLLINGIKPSRSGYAKYAVYPYGKKSKSLKKRIFRSVKKQQNKAAL